MFEILMTILVGGLVGWLASLIMKTRRQMGPLADVLVGAAEGPRHRVARDYRRG